MPRTSRATLAQRPERIRFVDKEKRTVAMNPAVYARLLAVAEQERRSISAQIECFIEESLDRRDQGARGKATPSS